MIEPLSADGYRKEAIRLRALAETFIFDDVRQAIGALATRYERLADRASTREAAGDLLSVAGPPQGLSFGGLIDESVNLP
jgi:hypothetical protein